jgi:hypothetical protein
MSSNHIVYTPHPDATLETEAAVLAAVYRFVLDCRARRKGGGPSTAQDARKEINESRKPIVSK